jgi:hypothetical protein
VFEQGGGGWGLQYNMSVSAAKCTRKMPDSHVLMLQWAAVSCCAQDVLPPASLSKNPPAHCPCALCQHPVQHSA